MVTYSGLGWASRHPALWFLPAYHPEGFQVDPSIPDQSRRLMGESERFLFDSVVNDLIASRPDLLFVGERENSPVFKGGRFHYLDYYSLDPKFVIFLQDYQAWTKVDDFRVYRRKRG